MRLGLVIATIIVLSNLAGVATSYFWLLAGEVTNSASVAALDDNKLVHITTCLALIAAATAISYLGAGHGEREVPPPEQFENDAFPAMTHGVSHLPLVPRPTAQRVTLG
ncbi:hypothetical protein SMICM17S_08920 [Streptomyces microflavus]